MASFEKSRSWTRRTAEFGKAAADAVRQWQFDSTLLNCVATEVAMMVRVTFEIVD